MRKIISMQVLLAPLIAAICAPAPSSAQTSCKPHSVNVAVLQVLQDPDKPGVYVSALQQGDIACISDAPLVGPQQLGFVVEKTSADGTTSAVDGWASVIFMTELSEAEASTPKTEELTEEEMAVLEADVLRFEEAVPYGPPQVRGKTLKELVDGTPMFAPIEGLEKDLWSKKCSSCHQWDAQSLCEQGRSYLGRASEVFRHQHPYGGAYKLSLMRWAKTGCN